MTAWYEDSFGREYLELYAHRDAAEARADVEAIVRLLTPAKHLPLLDLCCGACRHTLVLRQLGYTQIVGLDLSSELLEVGASQLSETGDGAGSSPTVDLVCSDMRDIPYESYFGTVLSLFTSFGYFDSDEENQQVFDAVHRALLPGGQLLVDTMSRQHVIANLVPEDVKVLPGRRVHSVRNLTEGQRRVEKATRVTTDAGRVREFHESVRLYAEPEMRAMLQRSGFRDVTSYGSLDAEPFGVGSKRMIVVARKGDG